MKAKMKPHKLLSMLLALVMVVGMLPAMGQVAYAAGYPDASGVYVNDYAFGSPGKLYYKNGDTETGSNSSDYNAHYDPDTGVLELNNYNSGSILIGGSVEKDIIIKLVGDNTITAENYAIYNQNGGDITITADDDATLKLIVTSDDNFAIGIGCDLTGTHTGFSREITISGKAAVTVNATATSTDYNKYAVGIWAPGTATIRDNASFKAVCRSATPSVGLQSAAGIYGKDGVTINTKGKVDIDVSNCSGEYNYGITGNSSHTLTRVGEMTIKWTDNNSNVSYPHVSPANSFDSAATTHAINVDTKNCVATYRYGTPYSVTVNNGSCNAANGKYLEDDTVTVTANTISGITFKKWSSADVTVADATNETTTFTMPDTDVTVTANYNLFTTEPSFTRISDTQGTISFTLAATPSSAPKLVEKNSDDVVGGHYFYGSAPERSKTVTDGTVPAGEYRIAVEYGGTWLYSDVFTVSYAGTAPAATVNDVTVSGTMNQTLMNPVDVVIKLTSDTIKDVAKNEDVKSWFTNLPEGLTAEIYNLGSDGKTVIVRINGTPTQAKSEAMAITIPGDKLTSGVALTVTENANAKFSISAAETHTHVWGEATYNWAEDGSSCTAERVCTKDDTHKETATATITSAEKTPATETVMGWTTYTATFTESWAAEQTKDVQDIPVLTHTHVWGEATYNWADDGKSCTAERVCTKDSTHKETATATITSAEKTPATETEKGWTTYTATFTEDWATTQTKDVQDIPVLIPIPTTYTVTFDSKGGSAVAAQTIEEGQKATKTADPTKDGYTFKGWTLNGSAYDFSTPVTDNITLVATWQKNSTSGSGGGGGYVTTYAIVVEDTDNGEISASKKSASKGTDITLTVKADEGYELDTLKVLDKTGDKVKVTKKDGKYTFEMPASKVTVEATFAKIEVEPTFVDVAEDAYYFVPIEWAVEEGITSGTSATTFSPDSSCTRAQAVTFLWRAAGSPAPKSDVNPFTDV